MEVRSRLAKSRNDRTSERLTHLPHAPLLCLRSSRLASPLHSRSPNKRILLLLKGFEFGKERVEIKRKPEVSFHGFLFYQFGTIGEGN
jgi:hypothetical protein